MVRFSLKAKRWLLSRLFCWWICITYMVIRDCTMWNFIVFIIQCRCICYREWRLCFTSRTTIEIRLLCYSWWIECIHYFFCQIKRNKEWLICFVAHKSLPISSETVIECCTISCTFINIIVKMFFSTTNNLKWFSVIFFPPNVFVSSIKSNSYILSHLILHYLSQFHLYFLLLYTLPCITVEEHNLKNLFSTTKKLLFNEKCPWMVYNER